MLRLGILCFVCYQKGSERESSVEQKVTEIPDEHSIVVNKVKNGKVIAVEDIHALPKEGMANSIVRAQCGVLKR